MTEDWCPQVDVKIGNGEGDHLDSDHELPANEDVATPLANGLEFHSIIYLSIRCIGCPASDTEYLLRRICFHVPLL